jgi:hypothetical protein
MILRMTRNDGIGLADISQAMQNYIDDAYVREQPQQRRHSIRTFMQPAKIKTWSVAHLSADPTLAALKRLEDYRQAHPNDV